MEHKNRIIAMCGTAKVFEVKKKFSYFNTLVTTNLDLLLKDSYYKSQSYYRVPCVLRLALKSLVGALNTTRVNILYFYVLMRIFIFCVDSRTTNGYFPT